MSKLISIALSACALTMILGTVAPGQTVLYQSELVSSTGWGYSHFGGTNAPVTGVDSSSAEFNWDYSQFGIPEAPHSDAGDAATRGLRLSANDPGIFPGDQIAVHYQDANFTGQYTLQVDVWANWASNQGAGVGTTEHAGVYAGFDPNDVNPFLAPAQNGAGVLFDTDGDCGNCDWILTKDVAELDTFSGQYGEMDFGFGNQPGYDNTDNNANIDIPALFPSFDIAAATNNLNGTGTQPAGAGGFQWITVTIEVDTDALGNGTLPDLGTAKITLESARSGGVLPLGTVDNSVMDDPNDGIATGEAPVGMSGGFALMMIDFFGGNPNPFELGFVLFDNVRVFDGTMTTVDCDFDGSTVCDGDDIDLLSAEIASGNNNAAFDLTGDGSVNLADRDAWLAEAGNMNIGAPYLVADFDLDGNVNGQDFIIWNNNKFTSNTDWTAGNANGDSDVNGQDFVDWNSNKFMSSNDGVNAVPEPRWAVWGVLLPLICLRRNRRKLG